MPPQNLSFQLPGPQSLKRTGHCSCPEPARVWTVLTRPEKLIRSVETAKLFPVAAKTPPLRLVILDTPNAAGLPCSAFRRVHQPQPQLLDEVLGGALVLLFLLLARLLLAVLSVRVQELVRMVLRLLGVDDLDIRGTAQV